MELKIELQKDNCIVVNDDYIVDTHCVVWQPDMTKELPEQVAKFIEFLRKIKPKEDTDGN